MSALANRPPTITPWIARIHGIRPRRPSPELAGVGGRGAEGVSTSAMAAGSEGDPAAGTSGRVCVGTVSGVISSTMAVPVGGNRVGVRLGVVLGRGVIVIDGV